MPTFKPIIESRVSDKVTKQLKQAILLDQFKAGEKMPSERVLAEQFQVSRLSIRESLRQLEGMGFLLSRKGTTGGFYVTDLNIESFGNAFMDLFLADKISITELHHLRLLIEPEIARMAASRITPEYAKRLKTAYLGEDVKVTEESAMQGFAKKSVFHLILADMSGDRLFSAILKSLMDLTLRYIVVVDVDHKDFHPYTVHKPILDAVLAGDPDAAYEAMKTHAVEFGQVLLKLDEVYRNKTKLAKLP